MSKPILPKEVAFNIEMLRRVNESNAGIVRIANGDRGTASDSLRDFADSEAGMNILVEALVIGYEVEKTDEQIEAGCREKVKRYYQDTRKRYEARRRDYDKIPLTFYEGELAGIESTLNLLDIKISGINERF